MLTCSRRGQAGATEQLVTTADPACAEQVWRPTWLQAHGLMMLATCIYATWNVVNRQMGRGGTSKLAFVLYCQVPARTNLVIATHIPSPLYIL